MSAINSYAGQYYQLPTTGQNTPTSTQDSTTNNSTALLIAALNGTKNQSDSDNDLSSLLSGSNDIVDLSPAAQKILSASGSSSGTSDAGSFILTPAQHRQINEILFKYKDAPQTQDTFNKIQDDLQTAGLAPDQLAAQDSVKSFSATQTLLDALNGKSTAVTLSGASSSTEQTKSSNFMKQVYSQWLNMTPSASVSPVDASQQGS